MRVAGAQIPVSYDIRTNVATIAKAIDFAANERADILLTPEGSLSGYTHQFDAAEAFRGLAEVVSIARQAKVALALGTCCEDPENGQRYNQIRFYDKAGTFLGCHCKILLCKNIACPSSTGELDAFSSRPLQSLRFQGVPIGGLICNDMWANPIWTPQDDPHLSAKLAAKGVKVIFHAVNSGFSEGEEWCLNHGYHETNLRLRARANSLWIVTVDAADPQGVLACHSPSGVVGPHGGWVTRMQAKGEQLFVYELNVIDEDQQ